MTPDEARERAVLTVDELLDFLGGALGRTAAYDAIRRNEIPSIRIGRKLLIPTRPLFEMLGVETGGSNGAAPHEPHENHEISAVSAAAAPDRDLGDSEQGPG